MQSADTHDAKRIPNIVVVLVLLITVMFSMQRQTVATAPPQEPPQVVVFEVGPVQAVQPPDRGELTERGERFSRLKPSPKPTPLPTPVIPTDKPIPYIFPPNSTPTLNPVNPVPVITHSLGWPLQSRVITQYYSSWHRAIDISAQCGSSVAASDGGTVTWAGWRNNGGGFVVEVDHKWSITGYNHLSSILVTKGQIVTKGQTIGLVGSTGYSTGCHLHWVLMINGFVNPLAYV